MLKKLKRGFTMIELLIVIAVLGVLAVAVLAAINPIEQINRARDNGSRSDAEQLIGSVERFYSARGFYPWQTAPNDATMETKWEEVNLATWKDDADSPVLTNLSAAGVGEVKESFVTRVTDTNYNTLRKYNGGNSGDSTYVCFLPKSLSFRTEAFTRCGATLPSDFPASACPDDASCQGAATASDATGCFVCLP